MHAKDALSGNLSRETTLLSNYCHPIKIDILFRNITFKSFPDPPAGIIHHVAFFGPPLFSANNVFLKTFLQIYSHRIYA